MSESLFICFLFLQVHYLSDPLQPGPVYFLVPHRCAVFGVCCEGVSQQVNCLIDEAHYISKGSNTVLSHLYHFFSHDGLRGETCLWTEQEQVHALVPGLAMHDGSSWQCVPQFFDRWPDWCFGLFKKRFFWTPVSSLKNICQAVSSSTPESNINIPINTFVLINVKNGWIWMIIFNDSQTLEEHISDNIWCRKTISVLF